MINSEVTVRVGECEPFAVPIKVVSGKLGTLVQLELKPNQLAFRYPLSILKGMTLVAIEKEELNFIPVPITNDDTLIVFNFGKYAITLFTKELDALCQTIQ